MNRRTWYPKETIQRHGWGCASVPESWSAGERISLFLAGKFLLPGDVGVTSTSRRGLMDWLAFTKLSLVCINLSFRFWNWQPRSEICGKLVCKDRLLVHRPPYRTINGQHAIRYTRSIINSMSEWSKMSLRAWKSRILNMYSGPPLFAMAIFRVKCCNKPSVANRRRRVSVSCPHIFIDRFPSIRCKKRGFATAGLAKGEERGTVAHHEALFSLAKEYGSVSSRTQFGH